MRRRSRICFIGLLSAIAGATAAQAQEAAVEDHAKPAAQVEGASKGGYVRLEPKLDSGQSASGSAAERQPEPALPMKPSEPSRKIKLTGGVEEKNLAIEWDDWHNEFGQAVASGMYLNFGEALNMPEGLTTWYRCQITADRRVKHVEVTKSSGNLWYDRQVLDGVYKLDGNSILAFPPGSQRAELIAEFGIKAGNERTGYLRFGDVEYHEVSPSSTLEKKDAAVRPGKVHGDSDRLNPDESRSP